MSPILLTFQAVINRLATAAWNRSTLSEAAVRQVMVLPLLQVAGFDIWNPLEVQPEETNAAGNRPDLIVRCGDTAEMGFILEIKRRSVSLDEGTLGQALAYAGHIGLRWVWLTNGQTWLLADEKRSGAYKEREVLRLELNAPHFAEDLRVLLERSIWANGQAETALDQLKAVQQRRVLSDRIETFRKSKGLSTFELALEWMQDKQLLNETEVKVFASSAEIVATELEPVLEPVSLAEYVSQKLFPLEMTFSTSRGGQGRALVFEDGSLEIQVGSITAKNSSPSFPDWDAKLQKLEREGMVTRLEGGSYRFIKPKRFDKPSTPAGFVAGASTNGRDAWKTLEGKAYGLIFPK